MGYFEKLPEKLRKKGGMIYTYMYVSRAFISLPRYVGRALIIVKLSEGPRG